MLEYDRIDISEGIDVNKKECKLCHYWYFLNKNFTYGPYTCDGCYNILSKTTNLKDVAIVHIKKSPYRIYFPCMSKHEAKKLIKKLIQLIIQEVLIVMIKIILIIIIMAIRMTITMIMTMIMIMIMIMTIIIKIFFQ